MSCVFYTVDHPEFDDYMCVNTLSERGWSIAEECGEDYEANSNWEKSTEAIFYLWREDKSLIGKYKVYREWSPYFTAFEIKED